MSDFQAASLALAILGLVFSGGGFVWISRNHMAHAQRSLDRMETEIVEIKQDIALIKGALGIGLK